MKANMKTQHIRPKLRQRGKPSPSTSKQNDKSKESEDDLDAMLEATRQKLVSRFTVSSTSSPSSGYLLDEHSTPTSGNVTEKNANSAPTVEILSSSSHTIHDSPLKTPAVSFPKDVAPSLSTSSSITTSRDNPSSREEKKTSGILRKNLRYTSSSSSSSKRPVKSPTSSSHQNTGISQTSTGMVSSSIVDSNQARKGQTDPHFDTASQTSSPPKPTTKPTTPSSTSSSAVPKGVLKSIVVERPPAFAKPPPPSPKTTSPPTKTSVNKLPPATTSAATNLTKPTANTTKSPEEQKEEEAIHALNTKIQSASTSSAQQQEEKQDDLPLEPFIMHDVNLSFSCMSPQEYDETLRQQQEEGNEAEEEKKDHTNDVDRNEEIALPQEAEGPKPPGFTYQFAQSDNAGGKEKVVVDRMIMGHDPFPKSSRKKDDKKATTKAAGSRVEHGNTPRNTNIHSNTNGTNKTKNNQQDDSSTTSTSSSDNDSDQEYDSDQEAEEEAFLLELQAEADQREAELQQEQEERQERHGQEKQRAREHGGKSAFLPLWHALSDWSSPEACALLRSWQQEAQQSSLVCLDDCPQHVNLSTNAEFTRKRTKSDVELSRCSGLSSLLKLHLNKCMDELIEVFSSDGSTEAEKGDKMKTTKKKNQAGYELLTIQQRQVKEWLAEFTLEFDYSKAMPTFDAHSPVSRNGAGEWKADPMVMWRAMTCLLLTMVLFAHLPPSEEECDTDEDDKDREKEEGQGDASNQGFMAMGQWMKHLPPAICRVGLTKEEYLYLTTSAMLSLDSSAAFTPLT